jgi:cytochrome b561
MSTIKKYPKAIIIIHWLTVVLLILVFYRGTLLENLDLTEANINTFRAHAIPGMLILILTLIRLLVKNKKKTSFPDEIEYYSPLHKTAVNIVNKLIYILLILTPLVGFVMIFKTGALSYDIGGAFPENAHFNETLEILHKVFVFSLVGLVIFHVFGVIVYRIKKGENLVKRMCVLLK